VVNISRPLSIVAMPGRPRISTVFASPASRRTWMPDTRAMVSATFVSGNLPMSSATIESTMLSASCLIFWALCAARRTPVTTTTLPSFATSPIGAASWASAGKAASRPAPVRARTLSLSLRGGWAVFRRPLGA